MPYVRASLPAFARPSPTTTLHKTSPTQSGDTGGILGNDWTTPRIRRLALLHWVQPHPSRLFFDGRRYVFKPGKYARPECDSQVKQRQQQKQPEEQQQQEQQHEKEDEEEQRRSQEKEGQQQRQGGRVRGWAVKDY